MICSISLTGITPVSLVLALKDETPGTSQASDRRSGAGLHRVLGADTDAGWLSVHVAVRLCQGNHTLAGLSQQGISDMLSPKIVHKSLSRLLS